MSVLTHGDVRKRVIEFEPFVRGSLEEMLKEKIERRIRAYVDAAKEDEYGVLTVNEEWLGVTLARNCELPSDTSSGPVGVGLCTYNVGTTNGARGTLGETPFALQEDGFPANLSMKFLMRTIPMLVWHMNKHALHARFGGWRKFANAYRKRFGMFDLVSIPLPKVSGVTIDLMKFMKRKDNDKFKGWVKATAEYFKTFLRFCGGASNARAIINACGMTASRNPWIFFLHELKAIAPKHAVVAYLQRAVAGNFIMPHASSIIDGRIKVGVDKLRCGDEALTKILSALFVDQKNGLSLQVRACYNWKLDRKNAFEAVDPYARKEKELAQKAAAAARAKEKELARKAAAEAKKAKKAERAARAKENNAKPEAKARKAERGKKYRARPEVKARNATPEAKARARASEKKYRARPEVKARNAERDKKYRARPEVKAWKAAYNKEYLARPGAKARQAAYKKEYWAKPGAKARKAAYMREYRAKAAKARKQTGGEGEEQSLVAIHK